MSVPSCSDLLPHRNKTKQQSKTKTQKHDVTFGGDGYVYYLDCGDDNNECMLMSKLIKLYILNM